MSPGTSTERTRRCADELVCEASDCTTFVCATLSFAMGVEAATVQRILRHSSISVTTGTYLDVIEQVQRSAVACMDALLNPAL